MPCLFHPTATTEIYPLSLHDALPIFVVLALAANRDQPVDRARTAECLAARPVDRSEEHTSELQSHSDLVCRLLLEKKKAPPRRCAGGGRHAVTVEVHAR